MLAGVRPEPVPWQLLAGGYRLVDSPSAVAAAVATVAACVVVAEQRAVPSAAFGAFASAVGSCRPWRSGSPCPCHLAVEPASAAIAVGA